MAKVKGEALDIFILVFTSEFYSFIHSSLGDLILGLGTTSVMRLVLLQLGQRRSIAGLSVTSTGGGV